MKRFSPALLLYLVPFSFVSLWMDTLWQTIVGYALSILVLCILGGVLCWKKMWGTFVVGNLVSYLSSLLFAWLLGLSRYDAYFAPFNGLALLSLVSLVLFFLPFLTMAFFQDSPRKRRQREFKQAQQQKQEVEPAKDEHQTD